MREVSFTPKSLRARVTRAVIFVLTQHLQVKSECKKLHAQPSGTILIKAVFSPSSDTQVGLTGCRNQVSIITWPNRIFSLLEFGRIRINIGEEIRYDQITVSPLAGELLAVSNCGIVALPIGR